MERWYNLTPVDATAGKNAELYIYDFIGYYGVEAGAVVREVNALGLSVDDTLDVRINSNGGDVFEGVAIANFLKTLDATVHVYVDGIAASIASVIAMAGDTITMGVGTFLMIHKPWAWLAGDADEMRKQADVLDGIQTSIMDFYGRSSKTREEIEAAVNSETWLNAEDSVAWGLADEAAGEVKIAAMLDLSRYDKLPDDVKAWAKAAEGGTDGTGDDDSTETASDDPSALDSVLYRDDADPDAVKAHQDRIWDSGYEAGRAESREGVRAECETEFAEQLAAATTEQTALTEKVTTAEAAVATIEAELHEERQKHSREREQIETDLRNVRRRLASLTGGFRFDAPGAHEAGGGGAAFWKFVQTLTDEGVDKAVAMLQVQREHPDAHRAMLDAANGKPRS